MSFTSLLFVLFSWFDNYIFRGRKQSRKFWANGRQLLFLQKQIHKSKLKEKSTLMLTSAYIDSCT